MVLATVFLRDRILQVFLASPVASVFGLDPVAADLAAQNIRWLSIFNLAFAAVFVLSATLEHQVMRGRPYGLAVA